MTEHATEAAVFASPFLIKIAIRAVERRGASAEALLASCNFDPKVLDDPDGRVTEQQVVEVWTAGALLTGDPCFGISCANVVDPLAEHLLFYVISTCMTLGDAVDLAQRYQSLVQQSTRFDVTISQGLLRGHLVGENPLYTIGSAQFGFTLFVKFAQAATGTPIFPTYTKFRHMAPPDITPYTRALGPAVEFNQDRDEFAFDEAILRLPLRSADANLSKIVKTVAEQEREKRTAQDPFQQQLRKAITDALPTADASLERVAARLGSSARTLQRRLRERGTTFFDELEMVRKEAAEIHLAQPGASVSQVALMLGFSDMTSFSRAFSRWFGCSPRDFRNRARGTTQR